MRDYYLGACYKRVILRITIWKGSDKDRPRQHRDIHTHITLQAAERP